MSSRSANSSGVTATGPIGPNPGYDLASENCGGVAAQLQHPFGQVLAAGEAGHGVPGVGLGDVVAAAADDRDHLDLPVHVARR